MNLEIPGYEVFEIIGAGGMAEVYRAKHLRLDREVALKVMLKRYSNDNSFCERFIREARIAASLMHPNIVQIYDVNRFKDTLFLSMEYVSGGDLTKRLTSHLSTEKIVAIIRDLSLSLDYAHEQGYIHRDIKPANILFRNNDSLALSDFGIARAIHSDTHMTQTGMVVGTPSFMSPEQAQGKPLNGSSDLYSVAVIAYQLVTGQLPYKAESSISMAIKHINDPIPRMFPELAFLQKFFDRSLAKKDSDRFANGKEMAEAFAEAMINNSAFSSYQEATTLFCHEEDLEKTTKHSHNDDNSLTATSLSIDDLETEVFNFPSSADLPAASPSGAQAHDEYVGKPSHTTMAMVFMQINKVKVYIFQPEKRSRLLVGLAILITAITGFSLFQQLNETPPDVVLSPGQKARIAQLLIAADKDRIDGNWVSPAGSNAYEKYLAVLAIAPNYPQAMQGIDELTNAIRGQVMALLEQGQIDRADLAYNALAALQPLDKDDVLSRTLAEAKENVALAISKKLETAATLVKSDKDAAITTYSEILALQSDNIEATSSLDTMAKNALASAESLRRSGKLSEATEEIERAKNIAKLLFNPELDTNIEKERQSLLATEKKQRFASSQQNLLRQAENAFNAGRLSAPQNKNAHYYYTRALDAEPNNAKAIAGLSSVYAAIIKRIEIAAEAGDIDVAKANLSTLQSLSPNHRELSQLRTDIKIAERDHARKKALTEKIAKLYERADIYLASNRARSADKIYAQIEKLSPGHAGLGALGEKIADGYVFLAQHEIDGRDWRDVSVWVQKGLRHVPDHKRLHELQAYADQQLKNR